jgi:hypothetical protein
MQVCIGYVLFAGCVVVKKKVACFGDVIMLWLCEGFCLFVVVMRKKKKLC